MLTNKLHSEVVYHKTPSGQGTYMAMRVNLSTSSSLSFFLGGMTRTHAAPSA
jgi:hypothetical protein